MHRLDPTARVIRLYFFCRKADRWNPWRCHHWRCKRACYFPPPVD